MRTPTAKTSHAPLDNPAQAVNGGTFPYLAALSQSHRKPHSPRGERLLALALVLIGWAFYAGPLLAPSSTLYLTDTFSQDIPLRIYSARTILGGHFPAWTPHLHCGYPIFADSQTGVLYPFFAMYLIAPVPETHDWFMALHFLLAALFAYVYLARWVAPLAAAAGALTFMGSSYFQSTHVVPGVIAAASWLPLVLFLLDRFAAGTWSALWWIGLVNALVLLAGHMQVALISFTLEAAYLLFLAWRRPVGRLLPGIAIAFFLPVLAAAIQIIPLAQHNFHSTRMSGTSSALSWESFSASRITPRHLATFFFPDLYGDPWHYSFPDDVADIWEETLVVFCGFAAIGLVPLGILVGRPRRQVAFWVGVLVVALLFATASPLFGLLHRVPVYNWFRWPARYMLWFSLAVSVLVAHGASGLLAWLAPPASNPGPFRRLLPGSALVLATMFGLYRTMAPFTTGADFYQLAAPEILSARRAASHFRLLPIARAPYGTFKADPERLRANALFLPVSYNLLFDVSAAALFDQGNAVTPRPLHEILSLDHPNALKVAAVTHLSGPMPPERMSRLEAWMYRVPIPPAEECEVLRNDPVYFSRFRAARPRAWMVHDIRVVEGREARLKQIASDDFDPRVTALVEKPVELDTGPQMPARIWAVDRGPNRMVVHVDAPAAGLLVIADSYNPDVRGRLDGEPCEVLRVNHAFRGVRVPKGRHRVALIYRVPRFRLGILVSAAALGLVALGITISHCREWGAGGG